MNEMPLKNVAKNDQSGQALVEYVLLLAITVALILGLMNQFYKPFGDWMKDYMGAYLECLIDVGELPSLGYDGGSGECNSKFQKGTITGGRPPVEGSKSNPSDTAKKSGANSDDRSSSGGGEASASRRNSAESRGFQVGGPKGADGPGGEAAGSGVMTEALPQSQYFRSKGKAYSIGNSSVKSKINGLSGVMTAEQQKTKKREQKPYTAGRIDEGLGGDSNKVKKLVVKPTERKIASTEEGSSWSFSEYLKYGVIIVIIIALVLFLGGQVLQISKSMEK